MHFLLNRKALQETRNRVQRIGMNNSWRNLHFSHLIPQCRTQRTTWYSNGTRRILWSWIRTSSCRSWTFLATTRRTAPSPTPQAGSRSADGRAGSQSAGGELSFGITVARDRFWFWGSRIFHQNAFWIFSDCEKIFNIPFSMFFVNV